MKQLKHLPSQASLLAALIASSFAAPAAWAFSSGSTGADGAFNPQVSQEIQLPPSGVFNYTTVNIPAGVVITYKKNALNTPVTILASGDVTITGGININGQDGKPTGTFGDGAQGDDGIPGAGGPGGFDGGRGGRDDQAQRVEIIRGGAGLGPGGGLGGIEGGDGCPASGGRGYYKHAGSGGAYATDAYFPQSIWSNCNTTTPAAKAYGSNLLQPLIGGSGGGGGRGGTNFPGSGGGGGAGAILIASSGILKIAAGGYIDATGGDGGGIAGSGAGGQGIGGSGGAIRLIGTTVTGTGGLYVNGGCITTTSGRRQSCGSTGSSGSWGGSPGRIRIEGDNITYTGSAQPSFVADIPSPVVIAGAPTLRIASVAGTAVPTNPTGTADVTLPSSTTGPIAVTFETQNVPLGNTVTLRVVPAYGDVIQAISPAITGSVAAGTASATVTLPQGPSTLQATTSYTVVVSAAEDYSRFANNERVEKVEVTVALQGPARAKLITASGKSYDMSYEALRAAGFKG